MDCNGAHFFTRQGAFYVCVRPTCPEVRDRFGTSVTTVVPDHVPAELGVQLALDVVGG